MHESVHSACALATRRNARHRTPPARSLIRIVPPPNSQPTKPLAAPPAKRPRPLSASVPTPAETGSGGGRAKTGRAAQRSSAAAARRRAVVSSDDEDDAADEPAPSSDGSSSASEYEASGSSSSEEEDDESLAATDDDDDDDSDASASPPPPPPKRKAAPAAKPAAKPPAVTPAAARAPAFTTTPAPFTPAAGTPAPDASADAPARYADRAANRFPFLAPDTLRDADGRRPTDADYNPRTLRIPPGWFKAAKVTEAQRQWWEFKARHFDAVLLFKMGKFYELFEMDAHAGAEILGLQYMKGDQPHCGFPEASYVPYAASLARSGRRVVVIEQTETPAQLAERNALAKKAGTAVSRVVARDVVAVLTAGTLTDPEMAAGPDATPVLALAQVAGGGEDELALGAAVIDAAGGTVTVGGWLDGPGAPRLRALLAEARPTELVLAPPTDAAALGGGPTAALRAALGDAATRAAHAPRRGARGGAWDVDATLAALAAGGYFGAGAAADSTAPPPRPPVLTALADGAAAGDAAAIAALAALGGATAFLGDCLLDRAVLCGPRALRALPGADAPAADAPTIDADSTTSTDPLDPPRCTVSVDGPALDALEVLVNTAGGGAGTLLSALDFCVTPGGRRTLRGWLCRPLGDAAAIADRQDAVAALLDGGAGAAADAARSALATCGDLDRHLARLTALATAGGAGRDADGVVLYEDAAKRRVGAVVAVLTGLRAVIDTFASLAALPPSALGGHASLLHRLATHPRLAPAAAALAELEAAADWRAAAAAGRVVPAPGADADVDAAAAALAEADDALAAHLASEKVALKCRTASLISLNKESHVLELPDGVAVPPSYDLVGQRKGFKRYKSAELQELVAARDAALAARDAALGSVLKRVLARVAAAAPAWAAAVAAASILDALLSLAAAAEAGAASGPMCRPSVADARGDAAPQYLRAANLRHPAADALVAAGGAASFVPNDVSLGGKAPPFVLLTGPNMGGKSTLLRQVCLAALAAHVGAWVPASSFALTTVDAIFVRMGARDALLAGQSTFAVELIETAAPLSRGTRRSLVALDELGRGTATADGAAIAGAVLDRLAGEVGCRGLFATHYHRLADAAETGATAAAVKHMAADVGTDAATGVETVTFLYKLADGACPKSYGTNVARLAGLAPPVVDRAAAIAADLEAGATLTVAGGLPSDVRAALAAAVEAAACGEGVDAAVEAARAVVE